MGGGFLHVFLFLFPLLFFFMFFDIASLQVTLSCIWNGGEGDREQMQWMQDCNALSRVVFVLYRFGPVCKSFCNQVRWCSSHPSPSTVSQGWFPLVGLVPYYILLNFNFNCNYTSRT